MAFRRSVTTRAKFFYQQRQRVAVPLSHIDRHDNDDRRRQNYLWRRDNISGSSNLFRDRRFSIPAAYAPVFVRNMSSRGEAIGAEIMNHEAADLLGENAIEAVVAPVANEVAAAATATGFFPLDAVLQPIDFLHSFTGMNWWASIAVTTILIRTILLPLEIRQMKIVSKFELMWREIVEANSDMTAAEYTARRRKVFNKLFLHLIITPCVAFFPLSSSIKELFNMANEVASFENGGALWFTDLTTPDPIFLPILTAFTFWKAMESYAGIFRESDPYIEWMDRSGRAFAATLALPLAASFPKAILFCWITSNMYSLAFGKVMQVPRVKMMLGVLDIATPGPPYKGCHPIQAVIPTIDRSLLIGFLNYLIWTKISDLSTIF